MPTTSPARDVFFGIPSCFRACCCTVRNRAANVGYEYPGSQFTRHLESNSPYDLEDDEWHAELEQLRQLIERRDDAAVWAWFATRFPKCMALIPRRRRDTFLRGVYDGAADEDLSW